jgi:hypothetical protein
MLASTANGSWLAYAFGMAGASLASQRTLRRLGGLRDFQFVVIAPAPNPRVNSNGGDTVSAQDETVLCANLSNPCAVSANSPAVTTTSAAAAAGETGQVLPSRQDSNQDSILHMNSDSEWVHTELDDVLCPAQLPPRSRLSLVIAISGWLEDAEGVTVPWNWMADEPLLRSTDVLALRWAQDELIGLGTVVKRVITTEIASQVAGEWSSSSMCVCVFVCVVVLRFGVRFGTLIGKHTHVQRNQVVRAPT